MGICGSVIFVAMAAAVEHKDMAMATSGLFQSLNISVATGITLANSILRWSLETELAQKVKSPEVIDRVMSDVGYVRSLRGELKGTVVSCYVIGLQHTYCELSNAVCKKRANLKTRSVLGLLFAFICCVDLPDRQRAIDTTLRY